MQNYEKKDEFKNHTDSINCIVTTSNHLFTASDDGTIGVWDKVGNNFLLVNYLIFEKQTMNSIKKLEGHSGWVYSVVVHDKYIFSSSYDGTINVWDKVRNLIILENSKKILTIHFRQVMLYLQHGMIMLSQLIACFSLVTPLSVVVLMENCMLGKLMKNQ